MTDKDAMIETVARIVDDEITKRGSSPRETAVSVLLALAPFMQAREQAARDEAKAEGFGWWPIETAPKDGTRIIAADFSSLDFGILGEAGCVCWNVSGEYWEDHGFQYCTIQPEPTHWTPLLSPPERNEHREQQDG